MPRFSWRGGERSEQRVKRARRDERIIDVAANEAAINVDDAQQDEEMEEKEETEEEIGRRKYTPRHVRSKEGRTVIQDSRSSSNGTKMATCSRTLGVEAINNTHICWSNNWYSQKNRAVKLATNMEEGCRVATMARLHPRKGENFTCNRNKHILTQYQNNKCWQQLWMQLC